MKLREDISRIKEVMGINESKKYSAIETLVDKVIKQQKKLCEEVGLGDFELIEICDLIDSDLEIKVVNVTTNKETKKMEIYLDFIFRNIKWYDTDFLMYEIEYSLEKWLGVDCNVILNDQINLYYKEDPQW